MISRTTSFNVVNQAVVNAIRAEIPSQIIKRNRTFDDRPGFLFIGAILRVDSRMFDSTDRPAARTVENPVHLGPQRLGFGFTRIDRLPLAVIEQTHPHGSVAVLYEGLPRKGVLLHSCELRTVPSSSRVWMHTLQ